MRSDLSKRDDREILHGLSYPTDGGASSPALLENHRSLRVATTERVEIIVAIR